MKKLVKINGVVSAIGWRKINGHYCYIHGGYSLCYKYTTLTTPQFGKMLNRIPNIEMACPKCREALKKWQPRFRKNKYVEAK